MSRCRFAHYHAPISGKLGSDATSPEPITATGKMPPPLCSGMTPRKLEPPRFTAATALPTTSFIGQCGKRRVVVRAGRMFLTGSFTPLRRIYLRKHRVSLRPDMHAGDLEARGRTDCFPIYVSATANHNGRGSPPQRVTLCYLHRGFQAGRHYNPRSDKCRIAADHDIGASFQGLPERQVSPPPHDNRMTRRERAKPLEICPEPPRQSAGPADDTVFRNRGNENQRNAGTYPLRLLKRTPARRSPM